MTIPAPILEAVDLSRRFTVSRPLFGPPVEVRAVDGVSLQVRRGETFAIVGESGCGKSTLARLLVRLIAPSGGSVVLEGRDIAGIAGRQLRDLRRKIQFVFQDPFASLNPRMSVGALIGEPLRVHGLATPGERRERVATMMRRVGLNPQLADRYPHEFSGGQRQRICIARALVTEPSLLVADEPVSALDVSIQAQVINILNDLKQEFGLTLILIAHDLAVIRNMADRVAVMYLGRVVESGSASDLFDRPLHPYTEALLAAIPVPEIRARRASVMVAGELPSPIAPPPGCHFHPRCTHAIDRCRIERPVLRALEGREVACHRAAELTLAGLVPPQSGRSPAARQRFDIYRSAAAQAQAQPTEPKAVRTEGGTPQPQQGDFE